MKNVRKGQQAKRYLGDMREKGAPPRARRRADDVKPGQAWWRKDFKEENIPGALSSTLKHIGQNQQPMEQESLALSRLYGGRIPGSAYGAPHHSMRGVHPSLAGRLTYNIMAIVVDSLLSKITKENLSTQFITNGGDYRKQRQAKKLSQFSDGITYETKMDQKGQDSFRDGCLSPVGIIHTYADWSTKRVRSERVMSHELYVDYADGFYGEPTQMHRATMVDRERLLESQWAKDDPEVAAAIKDCHDTGPLGYAGEYQGLNDMIGVGESWHLPSGVDDNGDPTDDGSHAIWISNKVLIPREERKWTKTRFPFSVYRWKGDTEGWHGIPLGRDLIGSQVEMNHLLIMFQRAFRMMAAFRIAVETGTVPDQHFQDKIGSILHVPRGATMPQFLTPPAMNEQYFEHFERIKARAFEIARLSQLSAVGQKPAGLDSGEAQRVYHDIESEGFSYAAKRYEDFRLDVTEQQVDVVRDIFAKEKGYKLRAPVNSSSIPGHRFLRQLDWKNVHLKDDEYILRGYSTSSLPSTPAGRLATVQDMMRAGLLDPDTGRKLLDFPDLAAVQSLLGAAEDWIMMQLDQMIDEGKPQKPDPYMNLQMAQKLGIQEINMGGANNLDEERMSLLSGWVQAVGRLQAAGQQAALAQQMQAAQAATGQQGGQPMGVGAPAQQSPMLAANGMTGTI